MAGKNTSVALSDHFIEYATKQVASGRYGSISEVIRDGLRLHEERQKRIEAFDAAIQEGLDSGPPEEFDFDAFIAEIGDVEGDGELKRAA